MSYVFWGKGKMKQEMLKNMYFLLSVIVNILNMYTIDTNEP